MTVTNPTRSEIEIQIPKRLFDVPEAARYLGMGHKVIRQLIQRGELPHVQRIPGRSPYLIDIFDLNRWIEIHRNRADNL
jgi:excisionase family DNA binding protein